MKLLNNCVTYFGMKRKFVFAYMALSLMTFTSCSNNPVSDLNDSGTNDSIEETINGAEVEKISIDTLNDNKQEEIENVMKFRCDNLHFVNSFNFEVPDEIGKYQVISIDNFQNKWDTLSSKYIPADIYDENKVINDEFHYPAGPEFDDTDTGMYVSVGNNGFFTYVEKTSEPVNAALYGYDYFTSEKSYYLNSDYTDDVYVLKGEEVSISDSVLTALEFASEFTRLSDYPQELSPVAAVAYQDESENAVIDVHFNNMYKGLPICSMPSCYEDLNFDMYIFSPAVSYSDEKDCINTFTVQYAYEDYETVETYDSIITPGSAVRLLAEKLSEYAEYDVLGMELVYCPVLKESSDLNEDTSVDEISGTEEWISPNIILELSPYWAVYMDVTPAREIYGLVNCVTGDIEFVNNQQ